MINIAVCDDEKYMSETIKKMAEDFFGKKNTDISVVEYSSGEELLKSNERIVICCEIIDRKVYLYLISGEIIDYYDRIENLEKKLDGRFFRCHGSTADSRELAALVG